MVIVTQKINAKHMTKQLVILWKKLVIRLLKITRLLISGRSLECFDCLLRSMEQTKHENL